MRLVRWLLVLTLVAVALLLLTPLVLGVLALEDRPLVTAGHVPGAKDAQRARDLAKRTLGAAFSPSPEVSLSATAADISAAIAFASRSLPGAISRVNMSKHGVLGAVTVPLPANPFGGYLNIRAGMLPSQGGLALTQVAMGPMELSGDTALWLLSTLGDLVIGDRVVSRMVEGVRTVDFGKDRVQVTFAPVRDLRNNLKDIMARLRDVRDIANPLGDPDVVGVYYAYLAQMHQQGGRGSDTSLAVYMGPLVELARSRSRDGESAAAENQAMILALTMYFAEYRYFERLIGNVRIGDLAGVRAAIGDARIGGRRDLMQHFLVSAGLQILADNGVSHTIGEFKELLDSNRGGSGFSFDDLAADRAGVRFAQYATDPDTAPRLQDLLAEQRAESWFMPRFDDLPSRMSEAQFVQAFGSVDDKRYRDLVRLIDERIEQCALYGPKA